MSIFHLANVSFPNKYLNAAGCWCTAEQELLELHHSASGGIVSKSCTELPRDGNPLPRFYMTDTLSINSTGLANNGVHFYGQFGRRLRTSQRKPYIVSVAGIEPGENIRLVHILREQYADAIDLIEFNLSCPNVAGKPQIGYDFEDTRETLRKVFEADDGTGPPLGVKLPPYFDQSHFKGIADVMDEFMVAGTGNCTDGVQGHGLTFATCINSLGNGMVYVNSTEGYVPSIKPNRGFGGVGGSVVKPFGLANVAALHAELPSLPLIGCGGIATSNDANEYIAAGASLVQVGTALVRNGVDIFEQLSEVPTSSTVMDVNMK